MAEQQRYTYAGVLHIHTTYSDGTGSVTDVLDAAHEARLDWIIITDHDTRAASPAEGWHNDVLVLVGHEVTPTQSHFLALDVAEVINREQPPQAFIDETYAKGGFGVMAHPDDHLVDRTMGVHPWADWEINRASSGAPIGIEIWNLMADWRSNRDSLPRPEQFTRPEPTLKGPTANVLAWWDRLNAQGQRTFALGGLDAHAFHIHHAGERYVVFPYFWLFQTLTNYVLLDAPLSRDWATASRQVYRALQQGQSYFVNRLYGPLPQSPFTAQQAAHTAHLGDTLALADGPITLRGELSDPDLADTELRLIGNGDVLHTGTGRLHYTPTAPGTYRLEGRRAGQHWLYTNPIYITA